MDNTYISTRKDEVYINVTFLGQGATFKQKKDAINLKTRKITGWELEKDTDDAKPSIEVTYQQDGEKPYQVVYRNEAQEETTVYWTAEEYREWTEKLAHLKLVESGKGYELKITLRDDEGFYYANVDAAAIVKELQP